MKEIVVYMTTLVGKLHEECDQYSQWDARCEQTDW